MNAELTRMNAELAALNAKYDKGEKDLERMEKLAKKDEFGSLDFDIDEMIEILDMLEEDIRLLSLKIVQYKK